MRRLILLRHTKSSWASPDTEDVDRPLNKRGKRSAKALGKWLRSHALVPDTTLCSSARRTRETWDGLALPGPVELRDDLYEATTETLLTAIREAEAETLLVIGHNPGIAELAQRVLAEAPTHERFTDYPTGALTIATFDIDSFAALEPDTGTLEHFLTPHDLIEAN